MKTRKIISLLLLSIYSVVLTNDIVPHHHHDDSVIFGFETSCCEGHHHIEDHPGHECEEVKVVVSDCSCGLAQSNSHDNSENHTNCESFKVQLSKLFAISFSFGYSFEQSYNEPKILIIDQDAPELIVKTTPIRRRGPPYISNYIA